MHHSRHIVALLLLSAWGGCATCPCGKTSVSPPPKSAATEVAAPVPAAERSIPVHKRGRQKLIADVGSAGGTLELDNGARLEIPAGALSETVQITFAEGARTTAFSNKEFERPVGPIFEIAPELPLASAVKVSVPATQLPDGFAAKDLTLALEIPGTQRAVEMQGTQTRWDYVPASSQAGRAVSELAQVPGFRLQFVVSKSE